MIVIVIFRRSIVVVGSSAQQAAFYSGEAEQQVLYVGHNSPIVDTGFSLVVVVGKEKVLTLEFS